MDSRRAVLKSMTGLVSVAMAGCVAGGDSSRGDVVVGPGGRLVFDPEDHRIKAGDTVTWEFESAGHNVSGRPTDSAKVRLPDGATPFSSYAPDESSLTLASPGETFTHQFGAAGVYEYVCVPHISAGMTGRITATQ